MQLSMGSESSGTDWRSSAIVSRIQHSYEGETLGERLRLYISSHWPFDEASKNLTHWISPHPKGR